MAELVGFLASIATLASLLQGTVDIIKHSSDAPREIKHAGYELEQFVTPLEMMCYLQQRISVPQDFDLAIFKKLQQSIDRDIEEFRSIENHLQRLVTKSAGSRKRLHWLVVGRDESLRLSNRLQQMMIRLTLTLTIFNTISKQESYTNAFPHVSVSSLPQSRPGYIQLLSVESNPAKDMPIDSLPTESAWSGSSTWLSKSVLSQIDLCLPIIGRLTASVLRRKRGPATNSSHISLCIPVPGSRAIDVRWLFESDGWPNFSIQQHLAFHKIVGDNAAIMDACREGDVSAIDDITRQNPSAVRDKSESGCTPLQMAVASNNPIAVQLLLERGAKVNELFGKMQTCPLAFAIQHRNEKIVRVLLKYNADCSHVTSYGWTPLFYLWWDDANDSDNLTQAESILRILAGRVDFINTYADIVDYYGWEAIHMAVMRGTFQQIRFLVTFDNNLLKRKGPLGWTALDVAISEGRYDIFQFLLPFYDASDIVHSRDMHGWTKLHISAEEGDPGIMRHLLRLGADPFALSDPSFCDMPAQLFGRHCTPLEVAEANGIDQRLSFLAAVHDVLGKDFLSVEENTDLNESWVKAPSFLAED